MRRVLSALFFCLALGTSIASDGPAGAKRSVEVAGVEWLSSLDAAMPKAHSEGKLILHLQMFGDLDDAFC